MNASITIGIWLVGLASGAGLAYFVLRRRGVGSGVRVGVAAVLAFGFTALLHLAVTPSLLELQAKRNARTELLAIPVYVALQEYEPAVFEKLASEYARVIEDRSRFDAYTDLANAEIGAVATRRIAHASEAALLALMKDMLEKLQMLRAESPGDCYRYLFPKASGPPDISRFFDRTSQQLTLERMADVIRTSAEQPSPLPPPERVEGLMAPIVKEMYAQFGADTAVLSRAEEPGVNRKAVCAVSVALYEKVLQLPAADAAAVIRSMTQL